MIKLSHKKIIEIHSLLCSLTGGHEGTRDPELLASAIEGIYATFDGNELYPTILEKGARLGYALISNHAFVDGNKRLGVVAMLVFLEVNGICLRPTNSELVRVGLAVASGDMKYDGLLCWVREMAS